MPTFARKEETMWQIASGHRRRSGCPGCIPLDVLPFVWCDMVFSWPRTVGQTGGPLRKSFFCGYSRRLSGVKVGGGR